MNVSPAEENFSNKLPAHRAENGQPSMVTHDEALIRHAFAQSPEQGYELLFKRYYAALCNHAIRFVYRREAAEDIVAEVFTQFWKKSVHTYLHTSFRAYLYKAVQHRSYNYLKQELRGASTPLENAPELSSVQWRPDEVVHYNELSRKIEAMITAMPPRRREAFLLHRIEGKKYAEIAVLMRVSVKAVEKLISQALSSLRAGLKNDWLYSLWAFLLLVFP